VLQILMGRHPGVNPGHRRGAARR